MALGTKKGAFGVSLTREVTVFINETGEWPDPDVTRLPKVVIEAASSETLGTVADRALRQAGLNLDRRFIWAVERPHGDGRRFMTHVPVVRGDDGAFEWPAGNLESFTVEQVRAASEEGWFDGDPDMICVERLVGGNGVLPGWEDLFTWLTTIGGLAGLADILGRWWRSWRDRGADSPVRFFDVVLGREEWDVGDLRKLLSITEGDAKALLEQLGYEAAEGETYRRSTDPEAGHLRRRILQEFMGRPEEDPPADAKDR